MPFCSQTRRLRATFHSHDDREPAGYWCRAYFREVNRYKCLIFGHREVAPLSVRVSDMEKNCRGKRSLADRVPVKENVVVCKPR